MKIKIGGNFYDVYLVENLKNDTGEALWGYCIPEKNTILIENKISSQQKYDALIHECIHAILQNAGIDKHIKKGRLEDFVDSLTAWLKIFLIDNDLEEIQKFFEK